jgi:DNA-binding transcriptional regulator YdaS (Cro superfamily)
MYKNEAVAYFGSQAKLARAVGVTQSAVAQWRDPLNYWLQCAIEVESKRKLKAVKSVDYSGHIAREAREEKA